MNPQIMVIEDEAVVAEDIRESLGELGYTVTAFSSAEEALAAAEKHAPDLVVADINLGSGMDGIEAARRLRTDFKAAVMFMTAHGEGAILERAKQVDPLGYLVKPVSGKQLHAAIQVAWQNHQLQERLIQRQASLESTLGLVSHAILYIDQNRKIETCNAAAEALLGKAKNELCGKAAAEACKLLDSEGRHITTTVLDQALVENAPADRVQAAMLETTNGRVPVACRISRIQSDQGDNAVVVFHEVKALTASEAAPSRESCPADKDPVTGLAGMTAAVAELQALKSNGSEVWLAAFVFERYFNLTERYGVKVADDLLAFYGAHLSKELPDYHLFRWGGPTFLAFSSQNGSEGQLRRDLTRVSSSRLMKDLQLNSRTALVSLSASWELFCWSKSANTENLTLNIDTFVAAQVGRQRIGSAAA
jgi:CheY-like chemotaxis protein